MVWSYFSGERLDAREKTQQFIRQTFIEPCSVHWARTLQNTKMHQQGLSVMWGLYNVLQSWDNRMVPDRGSVCEGLPRILG